MVLLTTAFMIIVLHGTSDDSTLHRWKILANSERKRRDCTSRRRHYEAVCAVRTRQKKRAAQRKHRRLQAARDMPDHSSRATSPSRLGTFPLLCRSVPLATCQKQSCNFRPSCHRRMIRDRYFPRERLPLKHSAEPSVIKLWYLASFDGQNDATIRMQSDAVSQSRTAY